MHNFISAQFHSRRRKELIQLFKHSLQGVVSILALLTTLTFFSNIAYGFEQNGISYNILSEDELTLEVTQSETEYSGDIVIPGQVTYEGKTYSVTNIGISAFQYCRDLVSVVIPNTTKIIGSNAFYDCSSLCSLSIPESVSEIGSGTFMNCTSLKDLTIPASVTTITTYAFYGCTALQSIVLPKNLSTIESCAFADCISLTSLYIPTSVKSIGEDAFWNCYSLLSVNIPDGISSIAESTFNECRSLTAINIPESVEIIGRAAFYNCLSLSSIKLPLSLISIGEWAFQCCNSLTTVDIPAAVTTIEYGAFSSCAKLENINVAEENKFFSSIDGVLYNKDATKIVSCPAPRTEFTFPNSVEVIGMDAFRDCELLSSIAIPNTVKEIESYAFMGCKSLKSVIIPPLVKSLEKYTFLECSSLESVIIPEALTSIDEGAFSDCTSLKEIQMKNPVPFECDAGFGKEVLSNAILYIPIGSAEAYRQIVPWKNFNYIEETDFSGIEETVCNGDNGIHFSYSNGILNIIGLNDPINISIYDIKGNVVYTGTCHIVNNLDRGIYFIKTGNKTIKIVL